MTNNKQMCLNSAASRWGCLDCKSGCWMPPNRQSNMSRNNRDSGIEIPESCMPMIKKHNTSRTVQQRTAEGTTHRNSEDRNTPITVEHPA